MTRQVNSIMGEMSYHYHQLKALRQCQVEGHKGIMVMTSDTTDSYLCDCCGMTWQEEKKV